MSFYKHFATCYGTFWIIIMTAAIIGQTHINAGAFGMFGFPIISACYAWFKISNEEDLLNTISELEETIYELEDEIQGLRKGE